MQRLTDAPRQGLTEAQVRSLIVDGAPAWTAGAELLTPAGPVDISDDLASGNVAWNGSQDVHRSCTIGLSRELAWGRDQLLLFTTATDLGSGLAARWNMGVFILSTPLRKVAEDPPTFDVVGEDRLALLVLPIGDTYWVDMGTGYLDAATTLITGASTGGQVLFDTTDAAKVLPDDMVWALTESEQPTRLRIINDLLKALGYVPLWVDQDGDFHSSPSVPDDTRPVEWAFDADDKLAGIVGLERTLKLDVWSAPNSWRFITSGLSFEPTEGAGMYTPPDYQSGGLSSIDVLDRTNLKVAFLTAVDQDALVAQGDAIVAADKRVGFELDMSSYPFPLCGHRDIATYADAALGSVRKVVAASWSFDLGRPPADTTWVWGQA